MELRDEVIMALEGDLADYELRDAWNQYCEQVNNYDDMIYEMSELDDLLCGSSALEVLDAIDTEEFNTGDNYIKETIYGYKSFDDLEDELFIDELATYIIENDEDFGLEEIRIALDEATDE